MIVAVGGERRKSGKTALVCAIVRSLPHLEWTAIKIGHRHGGAAWSIEEEHRSSDRTDTSRYLLAGARRAYWVQAEGEDLAQAAPAVRKLVSGNNAIIESNSVVDHLPPDLYLMLTGVGSHGLKESALRRFARVDAFARWDITDSEWLRRPLFGVTRGGAVSHRLLTRILQLAGENATATDRIPASSSE